MTIARRKQVHQWDNFEVVKRWVKLFKVNDLANRWLDGDILEPLEYQRLSDIIVRIT